jgi:Tat protein secretion system quality control protein TatD with DNase activity
LLSQRFEQILADPLDGAKVVAIGECGLDFECVYPTPKIQMMVFQEQVPPSLLRGIANFTTIRKALIFGS